MKIEKFVRRKAVFYVSDITLTDIAKEIRNLDSSKKGTFRNIPPKSLKGIVDVWGSILLNIWIRAVSKTVHIQIILN